MISKRSSFFAPKHSVSSVATENAKLVGYLRHSKQCPAVVLPVFVDADEDDSKFLYQRVNDRGVVAEFVFDPDLTVEDLVLDSTFDAPPIVSVGESPLHAYELYPHSFAAGRREKFRSTLKEFLAEGRLVKWPFAALEVARFVGDLVAEESYAKQCASVLMKRSPILATSWLAGSSLSRVAQEAAHKVILQSNTDLGSFEPLETKGVSATIDLEDVEGAANDNYAPERAAGLEWLNKADLNHESWARVWREIWASTRPFPLTRQEHASRGIEWLDRVEPNHGGWASVWYRIWIEAEPAAREGLVEQAKRWLAKAAPSHLRWPFVWQILWDRKDDSDERQVLAKLAKGWLDFPEHFISDWANVWLRMWDYYSSDEAQRETLRSKAFAWLGRADANRKQWSIVWNVLLEGSSDEASQKLLIERGLSWLKGKKPNYKSWKIIWAGLFKISAPPNLRNELKAYALQWLRTAGSQRADWGDVWLLAWHSSNDQDIRTELQQLAEQWLTNVRITHHSWAAVWTALWKTSASDENMRGRLIRLSDLWLLKAPSNEPQRRTIEEHLMLLPHKSSQK